MQLYRELTLLGAGLCALAGGPAAAQTTPLPNLAATAPAAAIDSLVPPTALTLQEAVELSYRRSPALEAQRLAREAAVAQRKAAWGMRLPQLGVAASYTTCPRTSRPST